MLLSASFGPQIWKMPINTIIEVPSVLKPYADRTPRDLWVPVILLAFFIAHLPSCVLNVARARRAQKLPLAPVFLEWTPMIVYTASACAWVSSPYSILLQENHLLLFCLSQSFVFGRMTTKIILAHLTRQPFPYWTVLIWPLVGGALATNTPRIGLPGFSPLFELIYLYGYFFLAVTIYFRWAFLVINSICAYLGINCLTIKPAKSKTGQLVNGKAQ